ncbi:MAG: hypothetical protein CSA33_08160 [Desulfobulbus propionicus]|nr:MAG: hypothetical protein CSA33_08160 [Desulfobulbus propionicus]
MKQMKNRGFTTVELVIVVSILAIAASIAALSLRTFLPNMQLKAATRNLYMAAMQAKSEAVHRNVNCVLTFNQTVNGLSYPYVVFQDDDGDCEYDGGEPAIVLAEPLPNELSVVSNNLPGNDDGQPTIIFRKTTIPMANGGGLVNGKVQLKNSRNVTSSVVFNQAGNIRIDQ